MKQIVLTLWILLLTGLLAASNPKQASFRMLRSNLISGIIPDINDAYGVAFLDLNNDSYPDIYITCFRNLNRLLINNGGIIPFIDRTIYSGLGGDLMQRGKTNLELGASVADYDNDGQPDLFLAGWGKTFRLFRNLGDVRFQNVSQNLNLHGVIDANQGVWFDADNDGYLDLYISDEHHTNRFLLNQGDGTFREAIWTDAFIDSATSEGVAVSDFDLDGDMDLYVCNWFKPDYFLLNDGSGYFTPAPFPLLTTEKPFNSNAAVSADMDNDGDPDLLVATKDGYIFYYRNDRQDSLLRFTLIKEQPFYHPGFDVYGLVAEDLNNDGWLDLFINLKGPNRLYLNRGDGTFDPEYDTDNRFTYSTGAATADLDQDGDLDLLVGNKDEFSQIYLNPTNNRNFVELKIIGVRSNRDAIGAKVFLSARKGEKTYSLGMREITVQAGYLSSKSPVLHIGTGNYSSLSARVVFPSGRVREIDDLLPGKRYVIQEYSTIPSAVYATAKRVRFLLHQSETWYVTGLTLFLVFLLSLYLRMGLKRYYLSTFTIAIQLGVWLTVAVILFIALHNNPLYMPLLAINGFSLLSILTTFYYSEKQLFLRRQRREFRRRVQQLSQRMLQIHDEKTLFKQILEAIGSNTSIQKAVLFKATDEREFVVLPDNLPVTVDQNELKRLSDRQLIILNQNPTGASLSLQNEINVLIPIRSGNQLLGIIGLRMLNPEHPINREDLGLLVQIANQTAIALDNIHYIEYMAHLTREVTEARLKEQYLKQLEATNRQLDEKNRELTRLFKELQEKEAQLIHSEKMAALGQLVAGITHELNNPVSFIYANSKALEDALNELKNLWRELPPHVRSSFATKFEELISDVRAIISDNLKGSQSIKELVLQLKNFSRLDQAEWKETRIVEGIESSLRLIKHQLGNRIKLIKKFEANPLIYCNPAQLNQVFVNILINAVQAIQNEGAVTIKTFEKDSDLFISISDTGRGIPQKIVSKIFDPFFTTKDVNQGTGLGLSISYSIIEKHGGAIRVKSEPGKGTTFIIRLPLKQTKKTQGRDQS
ncbi:MAG: GHKL domain-containing protein [Calditrichaeota bacterium]|nr:GHKL domain-containing protein [Calditrichota bacterium]